MIRLKRVFARSLPTQRRRQRAAGTLVGLLIVLATLLTACRAPEEPFRVAVLAWPPYDLTHLAVEDQLLDPAAFDMVNFQTPSEVVRSFRYGLVDAMFVTSHFALSSLRDVGDVRIVYVIDVSLGGDALLARPPIDSGAALAGRRVGVEAAPLGMYTLIRALGQLDLAMDDVEIVNVDTPDHLRAWQSGRIDAVVTYEPTRSQLRSNGAVELFNSESIPYEILDVLIVRKDTIDERGDRLIELVRGIDHALRRYRNDTERSVEVMARRHPLSPEEFRQAMAGVELLGLERNLELLDGENSPIKAALEKQCRVMVEAGMLVTIPDLDPLIDASVVRQAARE